MNGNKKNKIPMSLLKKSKRKTALDEHCNEFIGKINETAVPKCFIDIFEFHC